MPFAASWNSVLYDINVNHKETLQGIFVNEKFDAEELFLVATGNRKMHIFTIKYACISFFLYLENCLGFFIYFLIQCRINKKSIENSRLKWKLNYVKALKKTLLSSSMLLAVVKTKLNLKHFVVSGMFHLTGISSWLVASQKGL